MPLNDLDSLRSLLTRKIQARKKSSELKAVEKDWGSEFQHAENGKVVGLLGGTIASYGEIDVERDRKVTGFDAFSAFFRDWNWFVVCQECDYESGWQNPRITPLGKSGSIVGACCEIYGAQVPGEAIAQSHFPEPLLITCDQSNDTFLFSKSGWSLLGLGERKLAWNIQTLNEKDIYFLFQKESSWLEIWRPWDDSRQSFSSHRSRWLTDKEKIYWCARQGKSVPQDLLSKIKKIEVSDSFVELPPQYDDRLQFQRDRFLLELAEKGWTKPAIKKELENVGPARGWAPLTSSKGVLAAIKKVCDALDRPVPVGPAGNPNNIAKSRAKKQDRLTG